MLKIFLLSVCLAVGTSAETEVNSGDFPFFAQIKLKEDVNLHYCSASIIALDVLLTAAHCLDGKSPEDFIIFAGNATPQEVTQDRLVKKFVIHEDFNNTYPPPGHDIGIIFLTKPFENTKFVSPIEPRAEYYINLGSRAFTIGTGLSENVNKLQWLQKTNMFVSISSDCESYFHSYALLVKPQVTDDMVCTRNHDKTAVCEGDAGGPLVYKDKLVGIGSFGFLKKYGWFGETICDPGYPTVFVKLSNYYDWIDKTLAENPYKEA